jgi:hypothetical protein
MTANVTTSSGIEQLLRSYLEQLKSDYGERRGADQLSQLCAQLQEGELLGFVVNSISENLAQALSDKTPHEGDKLFTRFAESGYFIAVTIFPWLTPKEVIKFSGEPYSRKLMELATQMTVFDFRSPQEAALGILPWTHLAHWIYCCDGKNANVYLTLMPEAANPEADRTISIVADELLSSAERRQMGL